MFPLISDDFITFPSALNGSISDCLSITANTFFADPRADAKTSINGGSLEMFSAEVTKFRNTFSKKEWHTHYIRNVWNVFSINYNNKLMKIRLIIPLSIRVLCMFCSVYHDRQVPIEHQTRKTMHSSWNTKVALKHPRWRRIFLSFRSFFPPAVSVFYSDQSQLFRHQTRILFEYHWAPLPQHLLLWHTHSALLLIEQLDAVWKAKKYVLRHVQKLYINIWICFRNSPLQWRSSLDRQLEDKI